MQVLVEFWLNQCNYNGKQGDLLTPAQVKKASSCVDINT